MNENVIIGNSTSIDYFKKDGKTWEKLIEVTPNGEIVRELEYEKKEQPKQPETPQDVRITREDFDLLDVTYANTIYYIAEEDNTVTILRGED